MGSLQLWRFAAYGSEKRGNLLYRRSFATAQDDETATAQDDELALLMASCFEEILRYRSG